MERQQTQERFSHESMMIYEFYYHIKRAKDQSELNEIIEQHADECIPSHLDSTLMRKIDDYGLYKKYKNEISKYPELTTLDKISRKLLYFYNKELLIKNKPDAQELLIINHFSNTIDLNKNVIELYKNENTTIFQIIDCSDLCLFIIQTDNETTKTRTLLRLDSFKLKNTEKISATIAKTMVDFLTKPESEN